jgi:1-acyl-sn-glycerol-3-phosphate acyltransferase
LVQRYFVEPYRFIPPYRSTLWCRLGRPVVLKHLRQRVGVPRWHFVGHEHLQDSLRQRAGILLACNHCRWADPLVLGVLGLVLRQYFHYLVSYHLFKIGRLWGWWINRLGGYSILREGADREAIRTTAALLAEAKRPVVVFPEGTWFRQNDRLGPLLEGVSLMARQAVKQTDRPLVVHPVAIKYWALEDPTPALRRRLDVLEGRLGWQPQGQLDLVPRIEKLSKALLAVKEHELFGQAQPGSLDERLRGLIAGHLGALEKEYLGKEFDGGPLERVRRVRLRLVRRLVEVVGDAGQSRHTHLALDRLLFVENLNSHSWEYLVSRPSHERLIETVQRVEETVTDLAETPVVPHGAVVAVGPALDVRALLAGRAGRDEPDPLLGQLAPAIQGLLDRLLAQGPPPEWHCPPARENTRTTLPAGAGRQAPAHELAAGPQ